jgi:hypothetical protein
MNEAHGFATSCLEENKKGQERLPLALAVAGSLYRNLTDRNVDGTRWS